MTTKSKRSSALKKTLTVDDVKEVIGNTWFDIYLEGDWIQLETRDNGDVGEEEPGEADMEEARRILTAIREEWPCDTRKSGWETVDEWVHVQVAVAPRTEKELEDRAVNQRLRDKIQEVEEFCAKVNVEIAGDDKTIGCVLCMSGSTSVQIRFGERILYRDQIGAKFGIKTKAEAEALIPRLQKAFPDLEWTIYDPPGYPRKTWELREKTTFNYRPPNNIIERSGYIELSFKLGDDN